MKIKAAGLSFLAFFIFYNCFADKLEKGFERLHVYDYFNAREYFSQSLEKKTAGAAYGLSVIFSLNNNPFYNLDSARHYIVLCDQSFRNIPKKEKDYYQTLGINMISISAQKDSICSRAFHSISASQDVNTFNSFIRDFSFCSDVTNAVKLRNAVAFKEAKTKNTAAAWKNFLNTYPGAKEYAEASNRLTQRVYEEATADNKITSFENYLRQNPASPYRAEAENAVYALSVPHKTIEEYHSYVKKYPAGRHAEEAWRELFKIFTKDYNEQVLAEFKKRFPDYPFKDELALDFELQRSLFLPFSKNDQWGFINEEGKEMVKPAFDEVALFSEGLAAVQKNGKYGYINKSGTLVIPYLYDDAEAFRNNTAIVTINDKSGLIGRNGEELILFMYDNLSDPADGFYVAASNEKSVYVTKTGKKLNELAFDFAGDFKDGYAIAGTDGKSGLLNHTGNFCVEQQYDELLFLSNGLLKAKQNNHWGIINSKGETVTPFIYDAIGDFSNNRVLAVKNKKCGFIDEHGKTIIPVTYPFHESLISTAVFKNGYVVLKQKLKSVVLDSTGTKISFPGIEDIGLPSENLIPVKKNKKWGYADMNGRIKIPCTFEYAGAFDNNVAKIKLKKKTGIINRTGAKVIPAIHEDIVYTNHFFIVKNSGKSGVASGNGTMVLPCEYDRIEFLSEKIISASAGDFILYTNIVSGKTIWKTKD
ncbi:MAG: WG repeat-containing protein [Bacteroidetes bacterium]|nr:WG repeat-containing protein [Bacteroidota bacterium]